MDSPVVRNRSAFQIFAAIALLLVYRGYSSILPGYQTADLVHDCLIVAAVALVAIALLSQKKIGEQLRAFAQIAGCDELTTENTSRNSWLPLLAGLGFIAWMLLLLERHQPFFFTQDDNLSEFLPIMLQGGRSLMEGVFPTWNPYQLLGFPTSSLGIYALTYPFTYLSYFLSRFVLGNEFYTMEVFCILHVVLGYLAVYWAARCYNVRPLLSSLAAVCCVLSGWALIASRSWYYVIPVFVYMPLLMVGVAKLRQQSRGWKWIAGMGLVIGMFFHAGNVQFWTYGMMFMWATLLLLWADRHLRVTEILKALSATLLGVAIAAPLLVPQFLQTKGVVRSMAPYFGEVTNSWLAFLVPGPLIHSYAPADSIDPAWKTGGLIVYSGTTFLLFVLILILCFVAFRFPRQAFGRNVWIFSAVVAFLALLGSRGFIWGLMLRAPLLDKFRIPFKFLAFFNIFVLISGAIVCERLLRRTSHARKAEIAIVMVTVCLVSLSCMFYLPSLYTYSIRPYPDASTIVQHLTDAQTAQFRMMSLSPQRSRSARYWEVMPHNLATVYKTPALLGYDSLIQFLPRFMRVRIAMERFGLNVMEELGVKYVLVANDLDHPRLGGYPMSWSFEQAVTGPKYIVPELEAHSSVVYRDDEITIYQLAGANPLAFEANDPAHAVPITLRGDGLNMDTGSLSGGGTVVLNFFWYPEMRAETDQRVLKITHDALERVVIEVPPGSKAVRVRFEPPWWKGFTLSSLLLLLVLVSGRLAMREEKSKPVESPELATV